MLPGSALGRSLLILRLGFGSLLLNLEVGMTRKGDMATEQTRTTGRHLAHSHAKEGDIPGTVNLQAAEGDDTAYGQALFPVPANDPNDPLQWSQTRKILILVICSLYSFLSNSALLGPSVYIGIYIQEFGVTPTAASDLVSYANLAFGFGSLLMVPLYHKIGRRPVMLASLLLVRNVDSTSVGSNRI